MRYHYRIIPHNLVFKKPAKTSRNTFKEKTVYYLQLYDLKHPELFGLGEAAPLSLLSIDDDKDFLLTFNNTMAQFCQEGRIESIWYHTYPSMAFAIETALLDLKNGSQRILYPNEFDAENKIKINGLVWMNELGTMLEEALELVAKGYDCIKFKVGALDFDSECRLLEQFRKKHSSGNVLLRLDANGAFHPKEAKEQLKELNKFGIHSIEQPLKPEFVEELAQLSDSSIIDIALDESLIGAGDKGNKIQLLRNIKPQYIVLKPTLLGGLAQTQEWIDIGQQLRIGNWITSALESNIGLSAIAQFATKQPQIEHGYQGLGTGSLYENNIASPWIAEAGFLNYRKDVKWDLSLFI
jgi:o-succinylbenzoate synthase